MDFSLTASQVESGEAVARFARDTLNGDVVHADRHCLFSDDLWTACADFGVFRWHAPVDQGGDGLGYFDTTLRLEALGYGCEDNGLGFAVAAQIWAVQTALIQFGSAAQHERYLPGMLSGTTKACFAITESGSGSDAFALHTTAVKDGSDYLITGEKRLITMAPEADVALVFAVTNPSAGQWGVSAFLVDTDSPGVTRHSNDPKMGLRTVPFGSLTLDRVRVPADALVAREGAGCSIFNHAQMHERSLVLAPQVGAMRRQLESAIAFANTRERAGTPIGQHQSVSNRIADMAIRLDTCQLLLYRNACALDAGKHSLRESAITKTVLSEAFVKSSQEAIAIHGGLGYTTDAGVERDLRDAVGATLYGGTVDIQRNIIARMHGL
ncbi:MAG: acyl-CoA dehydrogenase family protein [Pseudomonadota bacterium]